MEQCFQEELGAADDSLLSLFPVKPSRVWDDEDTVLTEETLGEPLRRFGSGPSPFHRPLFVSFKSPLFICISLASSCCCVADKAPLFSYSVYVSRFLTVDLAVLPRAPLIVPVVYDSARLPTVGDFIADSCEALARDRNTLGIAADVVIDKAKCALLFDSCRVAMLKTPLSAVLKPDSKAVLHFA